MGFILRSADSYQLWAKDLIEQLNLNTNNKSLKYIGISKVSISSHARGACLPSIKTLIKICKALSVQTGESAQDILDCIFESIPEWTTND